MIQQPPTDLTPDDPKKLPGASPVAPAPTPAPVPAPAANVTPATPPAITANPSAPPPVAPPPNPGVSAAPATPAVNNVPPAAPATATPDWNTMAPGVWKGPGQNVMVNDPSQWNPTMSNDPAIIAQVNQMLANGVDPTTGRSTALNQAVTSKGYRWAGDGNIVDPVTGQGAGNAFTLGASGVSGLGDSARGAIAPNPNDATAFRGPTPATAAPALPPESAVPSNAGLMPNAGFGSGPSVAPPQMGNVETQGSPDKAAAMLRAPSSPMSRTDVGGQQSAAPSAMSNLPAASAVGNVGATPTTADNALTNQTLSRAPGADRFKIAQDQYDAAVKAGEPAFQASLRDAMRRAAAGGAIGSGALQSSLGDVVSSRQNGLDAARQGFLADALRGTIADQFGDVGIAQQQQGFQNQQQQQAFGNAVTQRQLEDQLTNSGFSRALQQLLAGSSGSPADLQLALSSIFGQQAASAGAGAAGLFGQAGQNAGGGGSWQQLLDWFKNGGTQAVPNANPTFGPITTTPRTPNLGIGY